MGLFQPLLNQNKDGQILVVSGRLMSRSWWHQNLFFVCPKVSMEM